MNFSESQKKSLNGHDFMLKTKGMLLILMYTERSHDILTFNGKANSMNSAET